jgi:MipA family protein
MPCHPLVLGLSLALIPVFAGAQPGTAPPRWEIGALALGVSQQAYPGSDTQISRGVALPFVIYRGEVLRADGDTTGLRALKTERLELDIGFAAAFGSSASEVPARQGMPELGTLVEFGPRLKWKLGDLAQPSTGAGRWRLEFPLRGVFDLSDGFARRGLNFEPELHFERRGHAGVNYGASLSAIIGDRRLADTFYSVAPAYATAARPAYAARPGLIGWRVGASFSRSLAPDWRLFGFVRVDTVGGAANADSPLVRKTAGATAGLGLAWTWMRSSLSGSD